MSAASDPLAGHPLECSWVERAVSVVVGGRAVRGAARANWGAIEVDILAPITNLTRRWDGRGWSFAMLAHHRPQERYAIAGQFTQKGARAAERFLSEMYLDWLAVSPGGAEVEAACRRARDELAGVAAEFAGRSRSSDERLEELRRAFRAGGMSQREYQQARKESIRELERIGLARRGTVEAIHARFTAWLEGRVDRRVSLDEAEGLLADVAVVVDP